MEERSPRLGRDLEHVIIFFTYFIYKYAVDLWVRWGGGRRPYFARNGHSAAVGLQGPLGEGSTIRVPMRKK